MEPIGAAMREGIKILCEARRGAFGNVDHVVCGGACDLIVIGHIDHAALRGRLLGDTADRMSDQSVSGRFLARFYFQVSTSG